MESIQHSECHLSDVPDDIGNAEVTIDIH